MAEIFRKVSLDRLSSPEQIDYLLHVTSARTWVALLALCGTLGAGIVWSVTSISRTTLNAQGVISQAGGVDRVAALATGIVTEIRVKPHDYVKAGEVVAYIAQPAADQKVRQARAELADAERTRTTVMAIRAEGDAAKVAGIKREIAIVEQEIRDAQEQLRYAKEQLPVDAQLVEKGLITRQTAIQNQLKVASIESTIEKLRAEIGQSEIQMVSMRNEASQIDLDHGNRIKDLARTLELSGEALKRATEVIVPRAGRVVEIVVYKGALVSSGQALLHYEPSLGQLEMVAFVPAAKAKKVQPGMEAHISPSGIQREEYGYMIGKVSSVGSFPASPDAIARTFENDALARAMQAEGPVTEVRIALLTSPTTKSGYVWSSVEGPPNPITSGSVSSVEIVTREQHPIEFVIPYVKEKLGLR